MLESFTRQWTLRKELKDEIHRLSPWYQPIRLGLGVKATVRDKSGHRYRFWSLDRGAGKWKRFIQPNLPFDLRGKRVLELGCNAGLFLAECVKRGAREAVGIEREDRYYEQARFFVNSLTKLHGSYYPIRIYQGSIEEFDYEGLGKFDLALLLNVIYHIGKSEKYAKLTSDEIVEAQVNTLKRVSRVAEHILFQANPLKDEGRGKGKASLMSLVRLADLSIIREASYHHPRGYILLTKSKVFRSKKVFPLSRMASKYFLPARQSAEREVVDLYIKHGEKDFDITRTRYYQLRTGKADWLSAGMSHIPQSLDNAPVYWVMPWSFKARELNKSINGKKERSFPGVYGRFVALIESILAEGFDVSRGAIPGYELVHPIWGEIFIYTDGNHRMGMLSHVAEKSKPEEMMVAVEVRQTVTREKLLGYPLTRQLISQGYFTERDVLNWFDNAFWFLENNT